MPAPGSAKKETKLGLSTTKESNFGDWYSEVVRESELISYYTGVSGCYILRCALPAAPPSCVPVAAAHCRDV